MDRIWEPPHYLQTKTKTSETKETQMKTKTLQHILLPNKTIPPDTELDLEWNGFRLLAHIPNTDIIVVDEPLLSKFLSVKTPSLGLLMKWSESGVAKSLTGKKVEPDGIGPDGMPSWLLFLHFV